LSDIGVFTGSCESGYLAFDQRAIHTADARRFTNAEDARDRSSLPLIHTRLAIENLAAEGGLQFRIGDEMKSASEHVAFNYFCAGSICHGD
jgi:hypothetical protein